MTAGTTTFRGGSGRTKIPLPFILVFLGLFLVLLIAASQTLSTTTNLLLYEADYKASASSLNLLIAGSVGCTPKKGGGSILQGFFQAPTGGLTLFGPEDSDDPCSMKLLQSTWETIKTTFDEQFPGYAQQFEQTILEMETSIQEILKVIAFP